MNTDILFQLKREIVAALPTVLELRATRTQKPDGSFVTKGDILLQEVILNNLGQSFPDAMIVSEELAITDMENSTGCYAVIDPIDGTENFTSGLKEWGVSISLYRDNKHWQSMVAIPELGEFVINGEPIQRHSSRIHGISSSLSPDEFKQLLPNTEYRIMGCCVYSMWAVINGSFASFENPRGAHSWDILAGLNLALEQGLNVKVEGKQYAGEYLAPTRKYRFKIEQQ